MSRATTLLAALAAVLVAALWWLFLYSPGQDEIARVEEEIAAAEAEQLSLQQRVARLEAVRARAPETEAAIARLTSILPHDPELASALRQISAAAEDAGMGLDSLVADRPAVVDEATGLHGARISLTATGSYFQLVDFLRRLEDPEITARGITFTDLTVTSTEYPRLTVALTGQMYAVLDPAPSPDDVEATAPDDAGTEAPVDAAAAEGDES